MKPFIIKSAEVFALRAPIQEAVTTSFGVMRDRPAVLIRIKDTDGITGWGEAWCNFPTCGAEHRVNLAKTEIVPRLIGLTIPDPVEIFRRLNSDLQLLANQSGELGPIAQVLAGIDIALWDIAAQRAGQPLWRYLGGESGIVPVYASGINPDNPVGMVKKHIAAGYTAFKLKLGFGEELDHANLESIRGVLGPNRVLMADANQAWNLRDAGRIIESISKFDLLWIEEPIPAHSSQSDWRALSRNTLIDLAGGENIRGEQEFKTIIDAGDFRYLQPDVAKWGGISGCLTVAKYALKSGAIYCPHWLGSSVGLMASAHLLAAVGGSGLLEIDANPNPLRENLFRGLPKPSNGSLRLNDTPGLGCTLNHAIFEQYSVTNLDQLEAP